MTPVVYDNLVYGHRDAVRGGPFERGELADLERLAAVIRNYGCQAVVHFAAYAYVGESVTDAGKYYRNNVCGSLSLPETMVETGLGEIIFSSTCSPGSP